MKINKVLISFLVSFLLFFNNANADNLRDDYPPIPNHCKDLPKDKKEISGAPKGCYNSFQMVLAWKPQWCFLNSYKESGCDRLHLTEAGSNLSPHGLWNSIIRDNFMQYTSYCEGYKNFTPQDLTTEQWSLLKILYPLDDSDLFAHEWEKHGSCSDSSPSDLFEKIKHFYNSIKTPPEFKERIGRSVMASELNTMFHRDIIAWCDKDSNDKQFLNQIEFFYDANLNPRIPPYKALAKSSVICNKSKPIYIRPVSNFVTIKSHLKSLIKNKIPGDVIGFDIDGTILFSEPGFSYGKERFGKDFINNKDFWNIMNNGLDKFSILKKNVARIITAHLQKKHKIFIITARSKTKKEEVTKILRKFLNLSDRVLPEVIFTGSATEKHKVMIKKGIKVYYGDSDTDISESIIAGVLPFRIMVSTLSSDVIKKTNNLGKYGETIIKDSDQ